jgi:monoamine oxidase
VLEGRERVGGRIHSVETQGGAVVEMGATWFFPRFNNLLKLLKNLKVELSEQYSTGHTMYESHARMPARKIKSSEGDFFRIKGGTSRIIESLYNDIDKSKVLLGQHVSEIRYTPEGMEVISNGRLLRSSRVVTTVPPQLLSSCVKFSPPLHQDVMDVMKNTHTWMGNSVKGAVTYKVPFWKEKGLSGALYSNPGPFAQMYDQSNENGAALAGFLNSKISRLSFEERKKKVIDQLVRVFGEEAKYCLDYKDTIWSEEHFTTHSHATRLSRHHNNGHEVYERPLMDGRLVIGGSETSSQGGGYMEGAVHSANKIAILLTNK